MRICLATPEYPPSPGGIASYVAALAGILVHAGHSVTVLTVGSADESASSAPNTTVVRLRRSIDQQIDRLRPLCPSASGADMEPLAVGLAMRQWMIENQNAAQFDIIEAPDFHGCGAFLCGPHMPALIVTGHGTLGQTRLRQPGKMTALQQIIANIEIESLALADAVVTHSRANQAELHAFLDRPVQYAIPPWNDPAIVARHPSDDPTAFDAARPMRGVVVGRLQSWKGAIVTAEAVRRCVESGLHLEIQWIGADNDSAPDAGLMSAYLQRTYPDIWGSAFRWVGPQDRGQTRRTQSAVDFAMVPSVWDVFNYTAVETLSAGTPLVITTGAGASDLCSHNTHALVIPPNDPEALGAAMVRLYKDAALRQSLSLAGPSMVARELSHEKCVSQRLMAYESAIQSHAARSVKPLGYPAAPDLLELMIGAAQAMRSRADNQLARMGGRDHLAMAMDKLKRRLGGGGE